MKERIAYVDAAKGLSILMIALGHITKFGNPVDLWMSSFKVSIFYIISGFLMSYSGSAKSRSFNVFAGKIIKSLGLPYVIFSIAGTLFKAGCVYLKHKPAEKIWDTFLSYLYDSIFLKGVNSMWFIPTLFIGELIFFWLLRSPKAIKILYAAAGLFAIKFSFIINDLFSAGGIFEMQPGDAYDNVTKLVNAACKGLSAAWFLGAGYIIYIFYSRIKGQGIKLAIGIPLSLVNLVLSQINTGVDFNNMKEGAYPYLFYVCGITGSVGAILLLDFATAFIKLSFLDYWGKNSLIIMCTHTVFGMRTVAYEGWKKVGFMPKTGNMEYVAECLVVLAILLLIEYSIVEIINSRFPFLIGKTGLYKRE